MKDLANERNEVCRRLQEFNFEPVNAENLGPTGANSWGRIQPEIESSDLMVLLLGERYGWIPTSGPGAERRVSVTELEAVEAKGLGIPILLFLKRLDDDADHESEDAKRRDDFRKRIKDWYGGQFIQSFDLASDLATKVGRAIGSLWPTSIKNNEWKRVQKSQLARLSRCRDHRQLSISFHLTFPRRWSRRFASAGQYCLQDPESPSQPDTLDSCFRGANERASR